MNFDKQKVLVNKLIEKTANSEIEWKPSVRENSYQLSFGDYGVRINRIESETVDIEIEMINSEATVVDSFKDGDLDGRSSATHAWFNKMRDLYDAARRQAQGADVALNAILDRLNDIPF